METLCYDGTFAGLLTAVFDVYEYRYADVTLLPKTDRQDSLFGNTHTVITDQAKATRLWKGLEKYSSKQALHHLYQTFLSEEKGMENILLQYIQYTFVQKKDIEKDFSHSAVLYVANTARKVHREKHRMEAFVRFQQTKDDLYYATVEPDFNVLPLIADHFEKRYADQQWMIYDVRRKYGIYYDLDKVQYVVVDFNDSATGTILNDTEVLYQQLWQHYFTNVNIPARKNLKLHIQHMPLRYWKYLPEKQPKIQ